VNPGSGSALRAPITAFASRQQHETVTKSKNAAVAADLDTPTDLPPPAVDKIAQALNGLLAHAFALHLKTKNFHWHISGRHFRDYHLMLDEQSEQIFATTDALAERVRKVGAGLLETFIDETEKRTYSQQSSAGSTGRSSIPGRLIFFIVTNNTHPGMLVPRVRGG
jgi:hypothetical protein